MQISLNLSLGSALATIGLTIPTVAATSIALGLPLTLGLPPKEVALLALSLLLSTMTLGTGRGTVLHGAVHLVLFVVFFFLPWCRSRHGRASNWGGLCIKRAFRINSWSIQDARSAAQETVPAR